MNESHIMGFIASAMQFVVAAYALRLNRCYGTARVGWSLFGAFSLLALLQLVQSGASVNATLDAVLKINVIYVLISFLLLIGMLHLESMLKERSRIEQLELQMRSELEAEVKLKTAYLTRAIEELMQQMEETKRMTAIIESSETSMRTNTADGSATTIFDQPLDLEDEAEPAISGIMSAEWIAHF